MYTYIYDEFLTQKKYQKLVKRIENTLIDIGIGGKICKLSLFTNLPELIHDEVKKGSQNIILVGNDQTVHKFLNILAQYTGIAVGHIPVDPKNSMIAQLFNIPFGDEACKVISARKIQTVPLAQVNDYFFIHSLEFESHEGPIEFQKDFVIEARDQANMCSILNPITQSKESLKAVIAPVKNKKIFGISQNHLDEHERTIMPFDEIYLKAKPSLTLTIDKQKVIKTPATIKKSDKTITMIVGKNT